MDPVIPAAWARDSSLSLKARGLLTILALNPHEKHTIPGLAAAGRDGKDAVRRALQQLQDAGYVEVRVGITGGVYLTPRALSALGVEA